MGESDFKNNGSLRMTTTKTYDLLNRLTNITSANASAAVLDSRVYSYDSANQRTGMTNADNTRWAYQYDSLGQVTSGKKYWSDGTVVAGQQFQYAFDDIGNRNSASFGGDQYGYGLRTATYGANSLNQYTNRTIPGYLEITGSANSNATVTIWNSDYAYALTYRRNDYFWGEFYTNNNFASTWLTLTNLAVLQNGTNADIITNTVGNAFVPKTPETFTYDADGNLRTDGRWTYFWDGENRLVRMTNNVDVPNGAKMVLLFAYDYQGRRISKTVSNYVGSCYALLDQTTFVYDGWNLVDELNGANGALVRSYMWGLDLRGRLQGSGGVGGLLAVNDIANGSGVQFGGFDANGNVTVLAKSVDTSLFATYEYGPFGELIRATGPRYPE